ncbi:MAG: pyridoxamine 5'-phosphate oxidase [Caulobacteraceae bacterium]|nr:MAG: pyridoxamine 5'-phosphate oxidase [Caulobacteraceae bacterium]
MGDKTLPDIAKAMKDIDFVMLQTKTDRGQIAARPMSNNRDVEYDGDSWFFLFEDSRTYQDIQRDPKVGLSLQGGKGLLGKPPIFIAVEGQAQIIRDKSTFAEHWTKDLDRWAKDGVDTPGLAMIKVHADRIHYWDGEDEGELRV